MFTITLQGCCSFSSTSSIWKDLLPSTEINFSSTNDNIIQKCLFTLLNKINSSFSIQFQKKLSSAKVCHQVILHIMRTHTHTSQQLSLMFFCFFSLFYCLHISVSFYLFVNRLLVWIKLHENIFMLNPQSSLIPHSFLILFTSANDNPSIQM